MKRMFLVAALVLILPSAALADGVTFGFSGGTIDGTGTTLTTMAGLGTPSTLGFVAYFPGNSPSFGGTLGTVSFATGNFLGNCGPGGNNTCYAAAGSAIQIIATTAFATGISNGTVLFSGSFIDVTTAPFAGGPLPSGPYSAGTGAILEPVPCTGNTGAILCFRLYGTIQGTLDPALLAALGLSPSTGGTGWIAQIDLQFTNTQGLVLNIRNGDAQLVVPEPASLALFGTGLLGIAGLIRRRMSA